MNHFNKIEEQVLYELEKTKLKDLLTLKDLVLISSYSESTIRRAISIGSLKAMQHKKNSKLMFTKESVMNWLEGGAK